MIHRQIDSGVKINRKPKLNSSNYGFTERNLNRKETEEYYNKLAVCEITQPPKKAGINSNYKYGPCSELGKNIQTKFLPN